MSHSAAGYARLARLPFGPHLLDEMRKTVHKKTKTRRWPGLILGQERAHAFPSCNVKFEFSTLRPYLYTTFWIYFCCVFSNFDAIVVYFNIDAYKLYHSNG